MPIPTKHYVRRKRELRQTTASIEPRTLSGRRSDDRPRPSRSQFDGTGYDAAISGNIVPVAQQQCARIGHNHGPPLHEVEPLAVSPRVAWHLLGCGNTHGYALLDAGELESFRDGRSRRITMRSIKDYIARRIAANATTSGATTDVQPRRRGRPRKPVPVASSTP
jgi:excisionase family DNA binding protein